MRSYKIDSLKGFAILLVVFYHLGLLKFGYLGVDVFLVIAGYLTTRSLVKYFVTGEFTYFGFLGKRIARVLPIVLLSAVVALLLGIPTMLPDDLENLSQSVVATTFFANNVLQCITTRNYWDVVNEYKPLMHTWYLGLLFQFYAVVPLIFIFGKMSSVCCDIRRTLFRIFGFCFFVSFLLFVLGVGETRFIFYYLPWRLFEFSAGALVALVVPNCLYNKKIASYLEYISWGLIIASLQSWLAMIASLRLVAVVVATAALIAVPQLAEKEQNNRLGFLQKPIAIIGMASLSIYIWHQIILAYVRYCVIPEITMLPLLVFFIVLGFVSWGSYVFIEKSDKLSKISIRNILIYAILFVVVNILGFWIHLRSGVLYDIPELETSVKEVKPGLHKKYNHKNYNLNRMFSDDSKKKVLVIGDSYARDWINVLLESTVSNKIDVSYVELSNLPNDLRGRLERAQYIFCATMGGVAASRLPQFVTDCVAMTKRNSRSGLIDKKCFLVGTKYFGESQGLFFCRRFGINGHSQTVVLPQWLIDRNNKEIKECQERKIEFVNIIGALMTSDGRIPVFTDEGKFVSQDCRHLTHAGAIFLSKKIDIEGLFN